MNITINNTLPRNNNNINYQYKQPAFTSKTQAAEDMVNKAVKERSQFFKYFNDKYDQFTDYIADKFTSNSNTIITRERYREALNECLDNLKTFSLNKEIELSAEDIRLAARAIGKITGRIEVEEILDKIFGSFCIGK